MRDFFWQVVTFPLRLLLAIFVTMQHAEELKVLQPTWPWYKRYKVNALFFCIAIQGKFLN